MFSKIMVYIWRVSQMFCDTRQMFSSPDPPDILTYIPLQA